MSVRECIQKIYRKSGIVGFYKGITASYFGISETVVHFVIYEALKAKIVSIFCIIWCGYGWKQLFPFDLQSEIRQTHPSEGRTSRDFLEFMFAGATSKTIASCIAYPHEVARTRLREEGDKYRSFWQTLYTVWKEEGKAGLYR